MPDNQRYRITEKIDAGGMAEVYRGLAESAVGGIKKAVAIKRILPSLTKNKKFVSMFLDEARVSMHLQHANIVGVFDIGMADTAYFIVMEFVDGCNLKTILESLRRQNKKLPMSQVIWIMMQVCNALSYAHDATDPETGRELGVVHRDISPPNILVSRRGEVKLVDFGLAKATSQLESTDPGVVKGKFSYLSPEAASGKDVDRRADIFAVGILLYELLTTKRLFYGETDYQTVELVRQAKVPPIAPQNPEVQPELEQIIRKALSRDLSARYQSAGDLQDALAQYLFSQRLKVTSRDIEQLVQGVIKEKKKSSPSEQPVGNLIDALINEEMLRFTSLDGIDNDPSTVGSSPSPTDNGNAPLDPGSFVDTRGWADDLGTGSPSRNGQPVQPRHRTRKDSSGITTDGLEDLLEGDGTLTPKPAPAPRPRTATSAPRLDPLPRSQVTQRRQSPLKLIALVVAALAVLAGAGFAAYFFSRH
jgi:eukaryotic-like serine/threonine-protein kinase